MGVPLTGWSKKDPDEVLDYSLDWTTWLDGDTIDTSEWTLPAGLTEDSESNTTTATTVWVSGGTSGESYVLLNRIVTAGGRTKDQTVLLDVQDN